ncbi:MAG: hypothetical protein QOE86_3317 [Solirubrobacteraceae bacterium]|jgi:hypothetical protein|nr:hypothetical protein [Solirubrobacteraceae bacterium]
MATIETTPAVLTSGVDGYPAGTHGHVAGRRQGCLVFIPDAPVRVARWARPRTSLLVPPALVIALH